MSENETQKDLIVKFKIEQGNKGPIARLWRKGDQHPEFLLFDVTDLTEAGVDWQACDQGTEHPSRFWCIWQYSEKTKNSGNPYKDVLRLEPYGKPTAQASDQAHALLEEVRAIKALLAQIAQARRPPDPPEGPTPSPLPDLDGALFGPDDPTDDPHPSEGHPEPVCEASRSASGVDEGAAKERFDALVTHALANETLPAAAIDTIAARIRETINGQGWDLAVECLQTELSRQTQWTEAQLRQREKVVARLQELLHAPQVRRGAVQHTLKPGWMWTYAYTDLIEEGKKLRTAIDNASQS